VPCCALRADPGCAAAAAVESGERERLAREVLGATRERMLREIAEAIDTLSAERPVLLVLEDLHWSDHSSLDLVGWLARRRERARRADPAQLPFPAT
jgi:predicted ATPase